MLHPPPPRSGYNEHNAVSASLHLMRLKDEYDGWSRNCSMVVVWGGGAYLSAWFAWSPLWASRYPLVDGNILHVSPHLVLHDYNYYIITTFRQQLLLQVNMCPLLIWSLTVHTVQSTFSRVVVIYSRHRHQMSFNYSNFLFSTLSFYVDTN
jgi:hypothetical protein